MDANNSTGVEIALSPFCNNKNAFDVKFLVKWKGCWFPFFAHRQILAIWSPVFEDKFYKNNNEIEETVEIHDIRPTSFSALLKYLYGSSSELYENKNNVKLLLDVYKVANLYEIISLKKDSLEALNSSTINEHNVFEILDAAIFTNLNNLKLRCLKVFQSQTSDILALQDVRNISANMLLTLLELPYLTISSEYELLSWVYNWAELEKSSEVVIKPFLPWLNFSVLKPNEFAMLVCNHKDFFDKEECFRILMNFHCPDSFSLPDWYCGCKKPRSYSKSVASSSKHAVKDGSLDTVTTPVLSTKAPNGLMGDSSLDATISVENLAGHSEDLSELTHSIGVEEVPKRSSLLENVNASLDKKNTSLDALEPVKPTLDNLNNENNINDFQINTTMTPVKEATICSDSTASEINSSLKTTHKEKMSDIIDISENTLVEESIKSSSNDSPCKNNVETSFLSSKEKVTCSESTAIKPKNNNSLKEIFRNHLVIVSDSVNISDDPVRTERIRKLSTDSQESESAKESSWEIMKDPVVSRRKIKKKKIAKLYLLPEGKKLPNPSTWNSTVNSSFSSHDYDNLINVLGKMSSGITV